MLSDKQPIIEELTARLRHVAEGGGGGDKGLGLRIVTVQIKEAVVSSARLWESLQTPFRSERERVARLAALGTEEALSQRELEVTQTRERMRLESDGELALLRPTMTRRRTTVRSPSGCAVSSARRRTRGGWRWSGSSPRSSPRSWRRRGSPWRRS